MDPADRAAALAAQYDDAPVQNATVDPYATSQAPMPAGGEDLPKFDVAGSPDELRSDLAVAVEHVGFLRELTENDAPADLVHDLVRRCQAMRQAVHNVIDRVTDEGVLDYAVQVRLVAIRPVLR